jgi:hypothetical protein
MQPDQRDVAYLWDMLDAARTLEQLSSGLDFTKYANDRRTQLQSNALWRLSERRQAGYRHCFATLILKSHGDRLLASETSWFTNTVKSSRRESGKQSQKMSLS